MTGYQSSNKQAPCESMWFQFTSTTYDLAQLPPNKTRCMEKSEIAYSKNKMILATVVAKGGKRILFIKTTHFRVPQTHTNYTIKHAVT